MVVSVDGWPCREGLSRTVEVSIYILVHSPTYIYLPPTTKVLSHAPRPFHLSSNLRACNTRPTSGECGTSFPPTQSLQANLAYPIPTVLPVDKSQNNAHRPTTTPTKHSSVKSQETIKEENRWGKVALALR